MNKHTKIPWEIKWQHQTGVMIGRVGDATLVADALNTSIDHAEAQANAELILQACNSHKDLLGACKAQHTAIDKLFAMLISNTADSPEPFYPSKCGQPWDALCQGNAAIAKAEE